VSPALRNALFLALGCAIAARLLFVWTEGDRPPEERAPEPPVEEPAGVSPRSLDVQGHRGARGLEPENTLAGFDRALRLGVSTLELDLGVTADGAVVVTHDPFIHPSVCLAPDGSVLEGERGPLLIDLRLEEVHAFDCGSLNPDVGRFPSPPREDRPGERIPTLDEVFDLVRQRSADGVRFNVEIKRAPGSRDTLPLDEFVASVIDVIHKYGFVDRTTIQAFDWRALQIAERIEPRIELAALVARETVSPEWNAGVERLPGDSVAEWLARFEVPIDDFSPDFRLLLDAPDGGSEPIESLHDAGIRVVPWTVNDVATMERLIDLGVDGIITDRPDRLIELCRRRGIDVGR